MISLAGGAFFEVIDDAPTSRDLDPSLSTGGCTPFLFGSVVLTSTWSFSESFGAAGAGFFGSLWVTPIGDEDDSLEGAWPGPKNESNVFCLVPEDSLGFAMVREKKYAADGRIKIFQTPQGRVESQRAESIGEKNQDLLFCVK